MGMITGVCCCFVGGILHSANWSASRCSFSVFHSLFFRHDGRQANDKKVTSYQNMMKIDDNDGGGSVYFLVLYGCNAVLASTKVQAF